MENAKLVRFERIKFGVKKPKPKKGLGRPYGMVMKLFEEIEGVFTARILEDMARARGMPVPLRASTLTTLKRLQKIGLIRPINIPAGRVATIYEKVKI